MSYFKFTKAHFEYELKGVLINNRAGFMEDITDQWLSEGNETWERIYKITTKNKAVDIIIFSSIDMRTNKVRDKGTDCVRLVMRWTTRKGPLFKRIAKHYRIETLFNNVRGSILSAQKEVFSLNWDDFSSSQLEAI